jgi:hypothetical protein
MIELILIPLILFSFLVYCLIRLLIVLLHSQNYPEYTNEDPTQFYFDTTENTTWLN